jgi:O-antigen ligase
MLYGTDILLISWVIAWLIETKFHVKPINPKVLVSCLVLLALSITGMFHVKPIALGIYGTLKLSELLILLLFVSWSVKQTEFYKISWVIFLSSLFQSVLAFCQFHVQHMLGLRFLGEYIAPKGTPGLATIDYGTEKLIRAYGTFPHPNLLGAFLILGIACALYLVSRETDKPAFSKWKLAIVSCGTVLLFIGTFLSFSRLAWTGSAITIICFMGYNLFYKKYRTVWLLGLIAIVSCGTIVISYPRLPIILVSSLDSKSNSVVLRESFNKIGIDLVKQNPILGNGSGSYISQMQKTYQLADWQYQPAHNIFIFTAAELGLAGLAALLFLIWQAIRCTWNKRTLIGFTLLVSLLVFVLLSNFDHYFVTIQQGQLLFFTLLGLCLTGTLVSHNDHETLD